MDAEERKAKKEAYMASLAAQKAQKSAPAAPTALPNNRIAPQLDFEPQAVDHRPQGRNYLPPSSSSSQGGNNGGAPSAREQKWEAARQKFLAVSGATGAGSGPGPAHAVSFAPMVPVPSFQAPARGGVAVGGGGRDISPPRNDPAPAQAQMQDAGNANLSAWKREGYPSEYAYAMALGVLNQNPQLQVQREAWGPGREQGQGQLQVDPRAAEQRARADQQRAFAAQLQQDAQQQGRGADRDISPPRGAPQHAQGQQQQGGFQLGGEDMDAAMKRERQDEYRRDLQAQQRDKHDHASGPQSLHLPGGGGLQFGAGVQEQAKQNRQKQYAEQLQKDQNQNLNRNKEQSPPRRGDFMQQPNAGYPDMEKDAKKIKQAAYARELEQQIHANMQSPQQRGAVRSIPGGGALAGLGNSPTSGKNKKNQLQQQYAYELEQDMRRKNYDKDAEKQRDRQMYSDNNDDLAAAAKADKKAKQLLYAQDLEEQMWNKQNKPQSMNLAGGGGGPLAGLGVDNVDKARKNQQQQYAYELEQDMHRKKHEKNAERARDKQLYGGGGGDEDPAAAAQEAKRAKQAQYAQDLEKQMWAKHNKPSSANLAGGGGLAGLGDSPTTGKNRKNQQQAQYAQELEQQMRRKDYEKNSERARDKQLYGGGGGDEDPAAAAQEAKRAKQAQYAQDLEEQMWAKHNKPSSANLPGGGMGGLAALGGSNSPQQRHDKQQAYANELDAQMKLQQDRKNAEKAQDRALYGGGSDAGDPNAMKRAKQMEYAAQLQAQQQVKGSKGHSSGGGATGNHLGGGGMAGIGGYEEQAALQKRAKQEEYFRLLREQEMVRMGQVGNNSKQQNQVDALANAMAGHVSPSNAQEWVMGPLGVPVRRTLEVGNRGQQKAFMQSPSRIAQQAPAPQLMMPQGLTQQQQQLGYPQHPNQQGVGMGMGMDQFPPQAFPGVQYREGGQPMHDAQQPEPGNNLFGPEYPLQFPSGDLTNVPAQRVLHDAYGNPVPQLGDLRHQGGDIQEERDARARALSKQQQLILEDQIRERKMRMEQENKQRAQFEEQTQERLDEERRQLHKQFEIEEKATKMKAEENAQLALAAQIADKKKAKEDEDRKEKERVEKEEQKMLREQDEIRQQELREIQIEQEVEARRKQKRDTSPFKGESGNDSDTKDQQPSPSLLPVLAPKQVPIGVASVDIFDKAMLSARVQKGVSVLRDGGYDDEEAIPEYSPPPSRGSRGSRGSSREEIEAYSLRLDSAKQKALFDPDEDDFAPPEPVTHPVPPLMLKRIPSVSNTVVASPSPSRSISDFKEGPPRSPKMNSSMNESQVLQVISGKELQNNQLIAQLQRDAERARQEMFNVRNEMQRLQRQVSEVSISAVDKGKNARKEEKRSKFYDAYQRKFGDGDESVDPRESTDSVFPPRAKPPKPTAKPQREYSKLIPEPVSFITQPEEDEISFMPPNRKGKKGLEPDGLRVESRFVLPNGEPYQPKEVVIPIKKDDWAARYPLPPSDKIQKQINEEKLVQYMLAAKGGQDRVQFAQSDVLAVDAALDLNQNQNQRKPSSADSDAGSEADSEYSSIMKGNRHKWALLKDFDDENEDVEALNVLMKRIQGRNDSRPSSAGSLGSSSSRNNIYYPQPYGNNYRASTAGSGSRPLSEQYSHGNGMYRDHSDASYNALLRGGRAVVGRDDDSYF